MAFLIYIYNNTVRTVCLPSDSPLSDISQPIIVSTKDSDPISAFQHTLGILEQHLDSLSAGEHRPSMHVQHELF